MRIIGIDPGTATTGFGVIEHVNGRLKYIDAGVILTDKNLEMSRRLQILHEELSQVIRETKPEIASVEQLFFAKNVTTAITVGQARGVILLTISEANLPIVEYTPMQIKLAVTGYGGAKKDQVQQMVKTLLILNAIPKPDDAADALAAAITHANQSIVSRLA